MSARALAWTAIALWVITIGVAVTLFVRGVTAPSTDGRTSVQLAPSERDALLGEMRGMLTTVQGIVAGVSAKDMKQVAEAARASGASAAADVQPTLMAKLPLELKSLGMSVHTRFDELAAAAEAGETAEQILGRLSAQLASCVGCHAAWRFDAASESR